jgi:hypothetical protein
MTQCAYCVILITNFNLIISESRWLIRTRCNHHSGKRQPQTVKFRKWFHDNNIKVSN